MFKTEKADWAFIAPATAVWMAGLATTAHDFRQTWRRRGFIHTLLPTHLPLDQFYKEYYQLGAKAASPWQQLATVPKYNLRTPGAGQRAGDVRAEGGVA
jgi:hypothetical protein